MSKKNDKHSSEIREIREKHNEDVINELLGEVEDNSVKELESDVANLGELSENGEDDVKIAETPDEKNKRKSRAFFAAAIFILILACIGLYSVVRFAASGIGEIVNNTQLKKEFARFVLPVVANDIAPFENASEITDTSKISCSIWNILINKDTSAYKASPAGGIYIPEYDVSVSCKDLFGSDTTLEHQSVGYGESRFSYDEANHVYSCPKDMRLLNYAPKITELTGGSGTYVLKVDYLPPSITMAAEDLGVTVEADKTLEYTITRKDKKNTLVSVRMISGSKSN